MKIAVFTSTFPPYKGGMGNVAFYEAEALAERGHDVTVFTPLYRTLGQDDRLSIHSSGVMNTGKTDGETPSLTLNPHTERARLLLALSQSGSQESDCVSTPALPFAIQWLQPIIQSGNAAFCSAVTAGLDNMDVIYLHYPFFGCAEVLWLNKLFPASNQTARQKLVIRYDMDVVGHGLKRMLFGLHTLFIMPSILRAADKVIFSSLDYAKHSNAFWLLHESPRKCREIPYGVAGKVFYPDRSVTKRARKILFVGGLDRAHYFKGLDDLLQAISMVMREEKDVSLHIVGSGDMMPHYRNLCGQLKISESVHFIGSCDNDQLRREYSESSVTVLPSISRSESFGLVLLESMACGTPVVANDIPGVRTLIEDGRNGYLARQVSGTHEAVSSQKSVEGLRSCIASILKGPVKAAQMGAYAREIAMSKYGWQPIARQLDKCFLDE